MKIKLSLRKMESIRRKCDFINGIEVGADDSKGGLCLGWRQHEMVILRSFSNHHIDMEVHEEHCDTKWRFTRFYGHPKERLHDST